MGVTSLKRKALRNRIKAKNRKAEIKRLSQKPTLKNIDVKSIWEDFEEKGKKPAAKKKAEAVEEIVTPKVQETEATILEEVKQPENKKIDEPEDSNPDGKSKTSSGSKKADPVAKKGKSK